MGKGNYEALDVANYIVNYCIDIEQPVSNLKLQKLLYYVQAASLVEENRPMFNDEICAWTYGPVVERVYHEFKSYANMNISDYVTGREINYGFDYDDQYDPYDAIEESDGDVIQKVVKSYQGTSPLDMVRKTHNEEPWKNAYNMDEPVINKEIIKQYYDLNRSLIYGTA